MFRVARFLTIEHASRVERELKLLRAARANVYIGCVQLRLLMPEPGEVCQVKSVPCGYPLPEGLPEGATVKVLSFDTGYYDVEFQGRQFKIFMMCFHHRRVVDIDGETLPEDHPKVLERLKQSRSRFSNSQ